MPLSRYSAGISFQASVRVLRQIILADEPAVIEHAQRAAVLRQRRQGARQQAQAQRDAKVHVFSLGLSFHFGRDRHDPFVLEPGVVRGLAQPFTLGCDLPVGDGEDHVIALCALDAALAARELEIEANRSVRLGNLVVADAVRLARFHPARRLPRIWPE